MMLRGFLAGVLTSAFSVARQSTLLPPPPPTSVAETRDDVAVTRQAAATITRRSICIGMGHLARRGARLPVSAMHPAFVSRVIAWTALRGPRPEATMRDP